MKLMTHVVVGYPSLEKSEKLVREMIKAGVDMVELQIPFSDPVADGPTIMHANEAALKQGVTVDDAMVMMQRLSGLGRPLLFMGYYNTVFRYGVKRFVHNAKVAGARGLIIPDIPPEEETYEGFLAACKKENMDSIRVLSPASSKERIAINAKVGSGFLYCVSRYGVTGAFGQLSPNLKNYLARVRKISHLPIAVGFGISEPGQVEALKGHADIAVVGSAVLEKGIKLVRRLVLQ